jgi:SAM-dependent methyltransferase
MHIRHKQCCRVCGNRYLKPVIDLKEQYLQGSFVKEGVQTPPRRKIPTQLVRCDVERDENACGLLQLRHTIPPEILYANYWYRSSTNQTMRDHLHEIMLSAVSIVQPVHKRVLDIGCNDGALLKSYSGDYERWGVDPSDIARTSIDPPIRLISTIFPSSETRSLLSHLRFDVITSIAMFYDLEDPVGFAKAVGELLEDAGIWIVEMSYMPLMLYTNSFDTICHEHLEYYSLAVLQRIMEMAGLRIFKASLNSINGGSICCYVCKNNCFLYDNAETKDTIRRLQVLEFEMQLDTDTPYFEFQQRIERLREEMGKLLGQIKSEGKSIHVYGASTKGNVLLQWYNIDYFKIEYAADRNVHKDGAQTLGTSIKIISEQKSRAMKPDYYLVLPWHFKGEFLEREREIIMAGSSMIFPLPEIQIVNAENLDEHIHMAMEFRDLPASRIGL